MKNQFVVLLSIISILLTDCGSDSPAAISEACKFTFKGISYSYTNALCSTVSGQQQLGGQNLDAKAFVALTYSSNVKGIIFASDALNPDITARGKATYTNLTNPSITISGKTWTFSGTLKNDLNDSGTISGTCNCTQ